MDDTFNASSPDSHKHSNWEKSITLATALWHHTLKRDLVRENNVLASFAALLQKIMYMHVKIKHCKINYKWSRVVILTCYVVNWKLY